MYHGERLNSISHLIGAAAAAAGAAILVVFAARQGDPWKVVSFSIYGTTLVLLYSASTLYHSWRGPLKSVFRKLDHHSIYLLIAGTYTPFTLVTLRGPWGWSIFGTIWGLAVAGMAIDTLPTTGRRILPVVIYLLMGWLCLLAIGPLWQVLSLVGFFWLLLGGLFYTGGIVFFALGDRIPHSHAIWHLFVLAGSISHFICVFNYIL